MRARVGSLRLRLLGATLVTLVVALLGAQWWLAGLFREHVLQQFDATLSQHLDELTARAAELTLGMDEHTRGLRIELDEGGTTRQLAPAQLLALLAGS